MTAYSPDRKAEHLLELSNEVNRIAGTLARLSVDPDLGQPRQGDSRASAKALSAERIRDVLRARRLRSSFLPDDLFADPASGQVYPGDRQ